MSMRTVINGAFMVSLFMVSWSTGSVHGAEQATKETTNPTPKEGLNAIAANSIDDTLKACLARIPEVATPGQRLLAEQNCHAEEKTRQAEQVGPRF
jgi:hypothetical protein